MHSNLNKVIFFFKVINDFEKADLSNIVAPNFRYKTQAGSDFNFTDFIAHFKKQNDYLNASLNKLETQITKINENKFIRHYEIEIIHPEYDFYMLIKTIATLSFKNNLIETVTMEYDVSKETLQTIREFTKKAFHEHK